MSVFHFLIMAKSAQQMKPLDTLNNTTLLLIDCYILRIGFIIILCSLFYHLHQFELFSGVLSDVQNTPSSNRDISYVYFYLCFYFRFV